MKTRTAVKDRLFRMATGAHRALFTATKGRVLGRTLGMPAIELITVGRRSGQERSTMLTVPVVDGDRLVLVASFGGDDRHPAWYLNLRAHPTVRVTGFGTTRTMRARTAGEEERAALWPRIVASYRGYANYQTRTTRRIPVVVLEPVTDVDA
ncbi:nitroreductase/quinone reductase family protein [Actinopolymorpha singaporensis]|uniref:Deazaflavin-dependent oxidoreductase, nitroreductase family n=1 Tax=Actinopolymorpha singaporensis TaxID=117157 RepID=A0A1H1PIK0_9ACTN|nr:nitroreductase/quinone reductase family protein [Actinopolymorpha singaporensis]SDS10897.1 deazaflavin-dependent oxidoreductase, nitroreductase family [Actinopolymorpha singaporensis]